MARSRGLASTVALALALACKPGGSDDQVEPRKIEPKPAPSEGPAKSILRAAGVELEIPADWIVLAEDEPNFALAYGPEQRPTHIPVCTIELRRQGPGPLPERLADSEDPDVHEYERGALRGRIRVIPGPEGSTIVVHCRAPRSTRQWPVIGEVFASLKVEDGAAKLPERRVGLQEPDLGPEAKRRVSERAEAKPSTVRVGLMPDELELVELCTGTPARATLVCARRSDGAVYCGSSTSDHLTRVALPSPAVQISCAGTYGCARGRDGRVWCWAGGAPTELEDFAGARDLAGGDIVSEDGELLRRQESGFAELMPLGDPELELDGVERVLEASNEAWGCVIRAGELQCWDREGELPLAPGEGLRTVTPAVGATDVRRFGDRLCVELEGRWTCTDASGQRWALDGCEVRPCGCSLIGATRLSCEHEPYDRIDSRPLGRVSEIVAVAEPCVARADQTVVCRGPARDQKGRDDPSAARAIAAELPGVAHTLGLVEDQK